MEDIMRLIKIYLKKLSLNSEHLLFKRRNNFNSFKSTQSRAVKLNTVIDNKSGQKQSQDLDSPGISNVFGEMQMLQLTGNIFNNLNNKKNKG